MFLLAYITGYFTPSYSCIMLASRFLLDASVDNVNSRFKSGSFRIGSDYSIFLTSLSLNAPSCSESHSTLFRAQLLVNNVKGAITSAQFGMYDDKKCIIPSRLLQDFFVLAFRWLRFAPQIHLEVLTTH